MNFPKERYRFIHVPERGRVVAVSSYAGKPVHAHAQCDPQDTYDVFVGESLAAARCNVKVAKKRVKRANSELEKAKEEMIKAISNYDKMVAYASDAERRLNKIENEVK